MPAPFILDRGSVDELPDIGVETAKFLLHLKKCACVGHGSLNLEPIADNGRVFQQTLNLARAFLEVQEEFGSFDTYIWQFVDGSPIQNKWRKQADVPATSSVSDQLSKDMKRRGFKFAGTTIMYAHLQATGLINDHLVGCYRYLECARMSKS